MREEEEEEEEEYRERETDTRIKQEIKVKQKGEKKLSEREIKMARKEGEKVSSVSKDGGRGLKGSEGKGCA